MKEVKRKRGVYERYFKRVLDIVFSLSALILLLPIFICVWNKVRRELGTPVLFTQIRPGKDGKLFKMYKFRSMIDKFDESGNLLSDEERLTDFGKRLRATSLDELPELFNILKGDMSLVGPRPQLVRDMVFFNGEEMKRQSVAQGLTGLAQISGRNNITWKEKFKYDLEYIENISFIEDMRIIYKTIFKVKNQDDIYTEGMATSQDYGEWLLNNGYIKKEAYLEKQERAKLLLERFE